MSAAPNPNSENQWAIFLVFIWVLGCIAPAALALWMWR